MHHFSLSRCILSALLFFVLPLSASPEKVPSVKPLLNETARSLGNTFAEVAEKVSPSVVVITVTRGPDSPDAAGPDEPMDPYEFFHKTPKREIPPSRDYGESQGSGFIVRADGYIFTNNHVIQGAERIRVKLKDGRTFEARVIGIPDEKTDIAVIKIEAKNLPVAEMGDSDLIRPGEWTIAIGAPFNLDYSVTVGVLSGKVRDRLGATVYEEYLQTQATINPGNSGGPLLDIDGKVVGINTLIKTRGGGFNFYNANVGFAIPIKLAQKVGELLITKGKVERPWIGIDIRTLGEVPEYKGFLKGVTQGVLVMAIRPETPAYNSGLKPGDVITNIDGAAVNSARDLQKQVLEKQIGQSVRLGVVREGKVLAVNVKTGLQPSTQQVSSRLPSPPTESNQSFGITVQPVTRELAEQFGLSEKQGLLITDVEDDSPAARSGLMAGMVITEVDGKRTATVASLKEALKKTGSAKASLLQVSKDGVRSLVIFRPAGFSEFEN